MDPPPLRFRLAGFNEAAALNRGNPRSLRAVVAFMGGFNEAAALNRGNPG